MKNKQVNKNNLMNNEAKVDERQRVSNTMIHLEGLERTQAKDDIVAELIQGNVSQGQALKKLRVQVLGLKQIQFAKMVKVSRKTLSDIENDKGNYSINTLNQIFRPFGLEVGLVVTHTKRPQRSAKAGGH